MVTEMSKFISHGSFHNGGPRASPCDSHHAQCGKRKLKERSMHTEKDNATAAYTPQPHNNHNPRRFLTILVTYCPLRRTCFDQSSKPLTELDRADRSLAPSHAPSHCLRLEGKLLRTPQRSCTSASQVPNTFASERGYRAAKPPAAHLALFSSTAT